MIKLQIHWSSMLGRVFLFTFLLTSSVIANETQNVEVLAQNVVKEGILIHAKGNVVLYSEKYLITADEAYYNNESGDVELIGNVTILEGISYTSRSVHTNLNLKTNKGDSTPLFFFDETSNIWLKCENAILNPESYIAQKSIVSSCNVQDPDWKISFTTGEFDKENKWLHLYNPVFYANDIPLFYLPYFSFSTDTTRRTGLLKPEIGFGSTEGLYYRQPIYFAPQKDWDLEIDPQIRTGRGEGVHSTYRFVDSAYSKGAFSTGYFSEHSDYAQEKGLIKDNYYGFKLMYDRSSLLSSQYSNIEDGLWVDLHYLNDIGYYNTITNETKSYDKLVVSRFNYYAKRDLDYVGIYSKYYIDTYAQSTYGTNNGTLQELPTLHYHRFSNSFLVDNLLYSFDAKTKNYYRAEGVNAFQKEINAPITFYFSLFDDYLHGSVSENMYLSQVSYSNDPTDGNYGQRFSNFHEFSLFTEVAKDYNTFFHTMKWGVDYIVPSFDNSDGTWDYAYTPGSKVPLIPIQNVKESVIVSLKEFFYNSDGKKKITHQMTQMYYTDYGYKYGDLENDVKYHVNSNLYLGNAISYSHDYSKLSRNQISINYMDDLYTTSLRYTNQDETYRPNNIFVEDIVTLDSLKINYDYVTLYAETRYIPLYNIFVSVDYDIQEEDFRSWRLGFKKRTKCWDYSLQYRDVITPISASYGADSVNQKGFMLQFNFYPIGSISQDFATKSEQKI
ncbi:MAG: LPS-assembly protein LptD [Campylobacteraceae bacterium]|nr:LPS-assembly protein LptD [Campylobacteraceae bacterium]